MKIYIVGSVASGKSTLARRISDSTGIPCYHLDEVMYIQDVSAPMGNRKRTAEERNVLFQNILTQKDYIIEDTERRYFLQGLEQTDRIVILEIPLLVRQKRILVRWLRQNWGLEKCSYKPNLHMLKSMFCLARNYDTGADGTKERLAAFPNKTVLLRKNKDIDRYIKSIGHVNGTVVCG